MITNNYSDNKAEIAKLRQIVIFHPEERFLQAFDATKSMTKKYAIAFVAQIPNLTLEAKKSLILKPEFENLLIYNTYFSHFYLETLVKCFDRVKNHLNLFLQTTRGEFITTCPEDLLK